MGQQLGEGFVHLDQAEVAHHLGPETRVQQVQDGVLDAADVLVHGHPVVSAPGDHGLLVLGIAVAHEVPGAVDKGVHGVGFAPRRAATDRADHTGMETRVLVQGVAAAIGHTILRQQHRQVLFGYRHRAVLRAMDDRNRRAPVALPAHTPVAQAPGGFFLTQTQGSQVKGHGVDAGLEVQAIKFARVDRPAGGLVAIPVLPAAGVKDLPGHADHGRYGQVVFQGKGKVALIVGWHTHHGAIAIAHQHIVADPHRQRCGAERMLHQQAGVHAVFLLGGELGLGAAAALAGFDKGRQRRVAECRLLGQRVFWGHRTKGHAHDGVGPGGEHVHAAVADQGTVGSADVVRESKAQAFALANPVFLHQLDTLGPARQLVLHMVQQLFGIGRDLQVVAWNFAFFYHCAGAPALAVNHLLIGQHSLVHRVPVNDLGFAVGNALVQHFQKQPLVPFVVARVTGGELAAPVDGQAHGLHLLLHVGDVVVGPLGRWHLIFQRGVFGRQAKGVPAHGHEHVVALHAQVAREHVVDGVVAHMAHVQLATRVGQHGAGVELFLGRVFADTVGIAGSPVALGRLLYGDMLVFFVHGHSMRCSPGGCQPAILGFDRSRGIGHKADPVQAGLVGQAHHLNNAAIGHLCIGPQAQFGVWLGLRCLAQGLCELLGSDRLVSKKNLPRAVDDQSEGARRLARLGGRALGQVKLDRARQQGRGQDEDNQEHQHHVDQGCDIDLADGLRSLGALQTSE